MTYINFHQWHYTLCPYSQTYGPNRTLQELHRMALINSVTFALLKILRNLVSTRNIIHNTFSPYQETAGVKYS